MVGVLIAVLTAAVAADVAIEATPSEAVWLVYDAAAVSGGWNIELKVTTNRRARVTVQRPKADLVQAQLILSDDEMRRVTDTVWSSAFYDLPEEDPPRPAFICAIGTFTTTLTVRLGGRQRVLRTRGRAELQPLFELLDSIVREAVFERELARGVAVHGACKEHLLPRGCFSRLRPQIRMNAHLNYLATGNEWNAMYATVGYLAATLEPDRFRELLLDELNGAQPDHRHFLLKLMSHMYNEGEKADLVIAQTLAAFLERWAPQIATRDGARYGAYASALRYVAFNDFRSGLPLMLRLIDRRPDLWCEPGSLSTALVRSTRQESMAGLHKVELLLQSEDVSTVSCAVRALAYTLTAVANVGQPEPTDAATLEWLLTTARPQIDIELDHHRDGPMRWAGETWHQHLKEALRRDDSR